MHAAIVRLASGGRVPIEGVLAQNSGGLKRWADAYKRFAIKGGQSLELHKQRLGRQTCVFTGSEYRNWVWERPRYTVCVSKRGVEFNVPPDSLVGYAWELWREYLRALGFQK
jgi:hypothetical protein